MTGAFIVHADSSEARTGQSGGGSFCERSDKQAYRRLDLPEDVDVAKVTA